MASTIHSFGPTSVRLLLSFLLLQAVAVIASPVLAVGDDSNNVPSLQHEPPGKRANPYPDFPSTYDGRVQKGQYLKSLFSLSDWQAIRQFEGTPIASRFQSPAHVIRWGWTRRITWAPFNTQDTGTDSDWDDLEQFDNAPGFGNTWDDVFRDPGYRVDPSENGLSTYVHEHPFYRAAEGGMGNPTQASYKNVVNPRSGAIVFDRNFSPRTEQARTNIGTVPDLELLSDLVYFQWIEACKIKHVQPSNIKLIYVSHVTRVATFNVVLQALQNRGLQSVPGWNNRVTLSMDSAEGLAILGTTEGTYAAVFLFQHKATLGTNKRITEVTVWGDSGGFAFNADIQGVILDLRFTVRG